jgi:hypothetical protein
MTSLEIAIIVAIVLIIAVAVGWYLYTTFVASTTGQPRLNVVSAEISSTGTLTLVLVNPGPVDVKLGSFEVAGQPTSWPPTCTVQSGPSASDPTVIKVGAQVQCTVTVSTLSATPGTMLPGRVILSGGQSFPFNALVKP